MAAASGLTIPIQITLSEIKLSAFIILVFSRQKGITLVFRNDPLESLRVSSTFDAIPFVRDYLQKEIEGQLRSLLMDELPLIIHHLSLRLFVPEYREREDQELARIGQDPDVEEHPVDPLASPPLDPVDASGNALDPNEIASLSLDSGLEMHALFSQKNLLRLSALTNSHKTLSLFTLSIRDAVFRAWAGPAERGELNNSGKATPAVAPTLTRASTYSGGNSTTYTFSDATERPPLSSRPTLSIVGPTASGIGINSKTNKSKARKRKHRIVNLRRKATVADGEELESISGDSTTNSETLSSSQSDPLARPRTPDRGLGELTTPPSSPEQFMNEPGNADVGLTPPQYRGTTRDVTPQPQPQLQQQPKNDFDQTPRQSQYLPKGKRPSLRASQSLQHLQCSNPGKPSEKQPFEQQNSPLSPSGPSSRYPLQQLLPSPFTEAPSSASDSGNEAQNAWMTKMASMIAQKVQDQKAADSGFWDRSTPEQDEAPPAYGL